MKYLIVNADDFGASHLINHGIIEAHKRGIVTSTSLMVNKLPGEAAELARARPKLSVGLHVDLDEGVEDCFAELSRQFSRFEQLMGRAPTHLDSHHNVHRDTARLPAFVELARRHGVPLREHSPVRYFSKFYGRWSGKSHPEQISRESLARMLETEIDEGITELSCHPGYVSADHTGSYRFERETELRTLCDPRVRRVLLEQAIELVSYHDLQRLLVNVPA